MNSFPSTNIAQAGAWHWIARLASCAMVAFFLMFALGEKDGFPNLLVQPLSVQLDFAALGVIFLGYAAGWRRPLAGAALILVGYIGLNLVEIVFNGRLIGGAFWLFAIPGLLYGIASWQASRRGPHLQI